MWTALAIAAILQITDGLVHDVNVLDLLIPEPGAIYVLDRGYVRIKAFYGTSENAVKTPIWSAVCAYVRVAIVRNRLDLEHLSLYPILQLVSVTAFEQVAIPQALSRDAYTSAHTGAHNQLQLFGL
jgi:hypothetical protein